MDILTGRRCRLLVTSSRMTQTATVDRARPDRMGQDRTEIEGWREIDKKGSHY